MNPDLELRVLAALASFFLKTTIAFGLCAVFSRLLHWPKRRLAVWLSFLVGTAGYWLWLAFVVFRAGRPAGNVSPEVIQTAAPAVGIWHLQSSWALPLGITIRAAVIVYIAILLYFLLRFVTNWWRLRWVMKFTTSPPAGILDRFHHLAGGLGLGRARLLVLSGVSSPATFGWIRPTVLLPDACLQQDPADLDDILLHELHHVRRWDFVWSRLATGCRSLVFFQPACWYALRRLNLERELACDLAVVAHAPDRRATYAECLVHFAQLHAAQQEKAWGIDFASPQYLKLRVRSILDGAQTLPIWSVCLRAICGVVLLTVFLGVVPSLAVLLSYTQQPGAQPPNGEIVESSQVAKTEAHRRTSRLPKSLLPLTRRGSLNAGKSPIVPDQSGQPEFERVDSSLGGTAPTTSQSGPQLLHRPSPGAAAASSGKQQTIALVGRDLNAQDSKAADRKQTLEQAATTALGVYRRLGAVDRH